MKFRILLLAALGFCPIAHAIDIVASGASGPGQVNLTGTYTQDFDSLLSETPSSGVPFVNNSTIPGWYSTNSLYKANTASGGLSSLGKNEDADRALGGGVTNWSLRFVNTTTEAITGVSVSYDVEQWYRGANSPQTSNDLHLYYRIWSAGFSEAIEVGNQLGAGWTHVPDATFTSPNATLTGAEWLDGNLSENQGHVSVIISGITLAPGEKLWLRWATFDEPGNDHALATDNVSVSFLTAAIPEPASAAALLGLAALARAQTRRSRRSRP